MLLPVQNACSDGSVAITPHADSVEIIWQNTIEKISFRHSFHDAKVFYSRIMPVNQGLLKACSNKKRSIHNLLDLTGGWGIDSFILAQHGKQVTMLEQNQLLHSIIEQSLKNASQHNHSRLAASRIHLKLANSVDFLRALDESNNFDCIYLDPMFPAHKSGAKPGKDMQLLQKLTSNLDMEECFQMALEKALRRVVVKRPAKSPGLTGKKPDLAYREKTIRFDVYLTA